MMRPFLLFLFLFFAPFCQADLQFKDVPGQYLDVLSDGTVLVRYMYEYDPSSEESLHKTYKPYLHVFDAEGKQPITKGAGGQFTHHRGIFIGWSRIKVDGKSYDRWHMKGGAIVHQKFLEKEIDENGAATFTSLTHWMGGANEPFLEEERKITVSENPEGGRLLIDFQSELTPVDSEVFLGGDPEHAGIQYRPADEVDRKKTKYLFPDGLTNPRKEKGLRWAAENYTLGERSYSVVHLNAPSNPKDTIYSAYRDYGRFGAFFTKKIPEDESLTVNYGFLIKDGKLPSAGQIDDLWEQWSK